MQLDIDYDLMDTDDEKIVKAISTPVTDTMLNELKRLNQSKLHEQTRRFFQKVLEGVNQQRDQETI